METAKGARASPARRREEMIVSRDISLEMAMTSPRLKSAN